MRAARDSHIQLLIYPATDQRMRHASHEANGAGYLLTRELIEYFRGHYLPDAKQYDDWRASPLLAKDLSGLPPAYVLTAGFDPLVDEGKEYAERLARPASRSSTAALMTWCTASSSWAACSTPRGWRWPTAPLRLKRAFATRVG